MKKTVIIAIFIVYLASIVAVQLFGFPATIPDSGKYVEGITITGVELTNRTEGDTRVREMTDPNTNKKWYWFYFIKSNDENGYTMEEESLASNPNRVRLEYVLDPEDASRKSLRYVFNNDNVKYLAETDEIVFLKKIASVTVEISESKGNINARDSVTIRLQ